MTGKEKEAKKIIRELDMEETLEAAQLKPDEVSVGFSDVVLETTCLLINCFHICRSRIINQFL